MIIEFLRSIAFRNDGTIRPSFGGASIAASMILIAACVTGNLDLVSGVVGAYIVLPLTRMMD